MIKIAVDHLQEVAHARFRLVSQSLTCDNPAERQFCTFCIIRVFYAVHHASLKEDRPILSAAEM